MNRISIVPKGVALSRYAMCLLKAGKGGAMAALAAAEGQGWQDTPQVAATFKSAVDPGGLYQSWGDALAQFGIGAELIEALRPLTILDRLAPSMRKVPFRVKTARETSRVVAGAWVGEARPSPVVRGSYDLLTIDATKCNVIVPLSKDLVRFSNPSAETDLRMQLTKAVAQFLDTQLLDPSVSPSVGIRPGALTYNADAVTSTGPSAAQKLTDLLAMVAKLTNNDVPMLAPYWVMRPGTAIALASTYNTAGNLQFPFITATGGSLLGISVLTSASSPHQIALLDASQALLADDGRCEIDASEEATLRMDDDPEGSPTSEMTSLWQSNLLALRAGREAHWRMAHDDGGSPTRVPLAVTYMSVSY